MPDKWGIWMTTEKTPARRWAAIGRYLAEQLAFAVLILAVMSVAFIVLSLAFTGTVRW